MQQVALQPVDLIDQARSGDRAALGELFARHSHYLLVVISNAMGPAMRRQLEPSDVFQETLLVATSRFEDFQGTDEQELLIWLRSLARRKVIDEARRIGRLKRAPHGQLSLDEPRINSGESLADRLAADWSSPSQVAVKRELAGKLADALTQIDPREAKVIWLHHMEGMSFESIGRQIGSGRNGVRGLWARGLRNLRRILPT